MVGCATLDPVHEVWRIEGSAVRGEQARVVIVGAGFGGLMAARGLARAPVDVLLIDRHNYHLFQPLLYQVATAALSPADIAEPIRAVLRASATRRYCSTR